MFILPPPCKKYKINVFISNDSILSSCLSMSASTCKCGLPLSGRPELTFRTVAPISLIPLIFLISTSPIDESPGVGTVEALFRSPR